MTLIFRVQANSWLPTHINDITDTSPIWICYLSQYKERQGEIVFHKLSFKTKENDQSSAILSNLIAHKESTQSFCTQLHIQTLTDARNQLSNKLEYTTTKV